MMEYLYSGSYATTPTAPNFCLPLHTKVYALASELHIQGLQELSSKLFAHNLKNYVADIGVYLSSIKDVYSNAGGENSELRLTVLYFGVTGIPVFLADDEVWKRFTDVMADIPDFQKDVIAMLVDSSTFIAEDEKRMQVICENCGPRDPDDVYEAKMTCKGCGVEKTLHFL
jgi:hypothetical protein